MREPLLGAPPRRGFASWAPLSTLGGHNRASEGLITRNRAHHRQQTHVPTGSAPIQPGSDKQCYVKWGEGPKLASLPPKGEAGLFPFAALCPDPREAEALLSKALRSNEKRRRRAAGGG